MSKNIESESTPDPSLADSTQITMSVYKLHRNILTDVFQEYLVPAVYLSDHSFFQKCFPFTFLFGFVLKLADRSKQK